MDDEKNNDIEQPDETAPETTPEVSETSPAGEDATGAEPADAERKAFWREGLVQEALSKRPELRKLATKKGFSASRRVGHDLGFEDGARKLTLDQLQIFGAIKARCLASYARHEMPGDLRSYLDERSVGFDEGGFLAGYVDGVADFLQAYRAQLRRQP
jgi:hypothetical protein